jgi:2-polyprenyl-3-methyl-5-hydroxy-6-metoxy-1,4-benzoquinol methylase
VAAWRSPRARVRRSADGNVEPLAFIEHPGPDDVGIHELLGCGRRDRYELARELCQDMRVLDLCCGNGVGSVLLSQTAALVVGIDHDASFVDFARAAAGSDRVSFEAADSVSFLDGPLGDRFDAIVCLEGSERLSELDPLTATLRDLRRPGWP